jgi:hypothetical protein
MPHGQNPDDIVPHPIEEAIGRNNDFPVREFGEFRDTPSGFRKIGKPS